MTPDEKLRELLDSHGFLVDPLGNSAERVARAFAKYLDGLKRAAKHNRALVTQVGGDEADREAERLLPCYFSHSCGNHEPENHSMSNGDCPGWLRKAVAAKLREGEQREQWLHKRVEELAEECVAFEDRIAALEAQIEPCVRRGGPTECDQRDLHAEQQQERIAALEAEVDKLNEIIASLDSAAYDLTHKSKSPTDNR